MTFVVSAINALDASDPISSRNSVMPMVGAPRDETVRLQAPEPVGQNVRGNALLGAE